MPEIRAPVRDELLAAEVGATRILVVTPLSMRYMNDQEEATPHRVADHLGSRTTGWVVGRRRPSKPRGRASCASCPGSHPPRSSDRAARRSWFSALWL